MLIQGIFSEITFISLSIKLNLKNTPVFITSALVILKVLKEIFSFTTADMEVN